MIYLDEDDPVNLNLTEIVTPLRVEVLRELLISSDYNKKETEFLLDGFSLGFDIGYAGPTTRQSTSDNIPFSIGNKQDLWTKIMKEVRAGHVTGPFESIPFDNYIQSTVGLVPKAGGKTRMIFHLSYNFTKKKKFNNSDGKADDKNATDEPSLNASTPQEICSVKYNDLDAAVSTCLHLIEYCEKNTSMRTQTVVYLGKTDLSSAFRVLPLKIRCFCWLVFKAEDPKSGKIMYFMDKCLPFGASISCSHYQRFSNALRHIIEFRVGGPDRRLTNYLKDFLFIALMRMVCNAMIQNFLFLCQQLNIPVVIEKTEWGSTLVTFLGILLNGRSLTLFIPLEKRTKALNQ